MRITKNDFPANRAARFRALCLTVNLCLKDIDVLLEKNIKVQVALKEKLARIEKTIIERAGDPVTETEGSSSAEQGNTSGTQ